MEISSTKRVRVKPPWRYIVYYIYMYSSVVQESCNDLLYVKQIVTTFLKFEESDLNSICFNFKSSTYNINIVQ